MPVAIVPIAVTSLGSGVQNVYFSNIPQTYKHLLLIGTGYMATNTNYFMGDIQFNGDTTNSYSSVTWGVQNSVFTGNNITSTDRLAEDSNYIPWNGNSPKRGGSFTWQILNYASSSTKKPAIFRANGSQFADANQTQFLTFGAWNNTSAITSIRIFTSYQGSNFFDSDTKFELYGVL